ncbi:Uncharacterised protein [Enterobacter roggenkampii]|uniref:Uncharacterized protein n=1 Tax=Enterobacter roggenkampii TaxID=1812935 RepID=A0ABD7KND2_9ENTR|nr:Uncharacterised protein [Enterobacter roggenkampii]
MVRVCHFHLKGFTIRNPAAINRHKGPVTLLEAFISQRSRTTYTATGFLTARQLLHGTTNGIIRGACSSHCRLVSIHNRPLVLEIPVCLAQAWAFTVTPVSKERRKPGNLLRLLRFKMARGQHGHTLNAWLCGFKNGQPFLEATGANTGTAGAFAGIGHLSSLKQMCRQCTFTRLDRDVVNRCGTGHPGIAQFLHFHCQNSTSIGDLFLFISQRAHLTFKKSRALAD